MIHKQIQQNLPMTKIFPKNKQAISSSDIDNQNQKQVRTSLDSLKISQITKNSSNLLKSNGSNQKTNLQDPNISHISKHPAHKIEQQSKKSAEDEAQQPKQPPKPSTNMQINNEPYNKIKLDNKDDVDKLIITREQNINKKQGLKQDRLKENNNIIQQGYSLQQLHQDQQSNINKNEVSKMQMNEDIQICQVCFIQFPFNMFQVLSCGHHFCQGCVIKLLQQSSSSSKPFKCPKQDCRRIVNINKMQILNRLPSQTARKLKKYSLYLSIDDKNKQVLCPNQNCQDGILKLTLNNKNQQPSQIKCKKCSEVYCSRCLNPPHSLLLLCKSWREEFNVLESSLNYCRCQKCLNIIEKAQGCQHMTCKCGYQFCFKCGRRWRKFHYCNPFEYSQHRRQTIYEDQVIPSTSDYAIFIFSQIAKFIWALCVIAYFFPFLILGQILGVLGIIIGIFFIGITYGFYLVLSESCTKNQLKSILLKSILFPYGMIEGVIKIGSLHYYKLCQLSILLLRGADVILPFNCIPFQCLT